MDPRMTTETLGLLAVFLDDPASPRYGLELAAAAGVKTGTLYPCLARLEKAGWLSSRWEEIDPRQAGRPRRRLYELTDRGAERARDAIETQMARLRAAQHPKARVQPLPLPRHA
jgi:PadR family transcriptional regulator, regulatory protein PadR